MRVNVALRQTKTGGYLTNFPFLSFPMKDDHKAKQNSQGTAKRTYQAMEIDSIGAKDEL